MTLYKPSDARIVNLEEPRLHALVIGVGAYPHLVGNTKHPTFGLNPLTTTRISAQRVAGWLATNYRNPHCPFGSIDLLLSPSGLVPPAEGGIASVPIETPTLANVQQAYNRWRERCDKHYENIAVLYFAGHGISTGTSSLSLLLDNFADPLVPDLWANCLDFFGVRDGMKGCRAGTQLYFVDACREISIEALVQRNVRGAHGACLGTATVLQNVASYTYYAASSGHQAYGLEDQMTFFSEALLNSLNGAGAEMKDGRRVITTNTLGTSIQRILASRPEKDLSSSNDMDGNEADIHFPAPAVSVDRPRAPALEEALGYATQAFREYLNRNVVENVELIYFLSYDVWDGCLLYDGLVQDSIEQRLLNYIRRTFLGRDRLRSHYEKLESNREELGAAGRCFRDALDFVSGKDVIAGRDSLDCLWYIGDLTKYSSEYKAFDRLLGLESCVYIPVVGDLVPGLPDHGDRKPIGGILMAANRSPYGLTPCGSARRLWEEANEQLRNPNSEEDFRRKDRQISHAIVETFGTSVKRDLRHFLACIGSVYSEKARARSNLRRIMHPRFVKAVARVLKTTGDEEEERERLAIEKIGTRAAQAPRPKMDWTKKYTLEFGEYRSEIVNEVPDGDKRNQLVSSYLTACVWRDLKLEERLQGNGSTIEERLKLQDVQNALREKPPLVETDRSLDDYIKASSEPFQRRPLDYDQKLGEGDTALFRYEAINELIDDLRECQHGPFELLARPLQSLAPIEEYLRAIADIEGVLASTQHQKYFYQVAHSLQVWMLGAWMLEKKVDDNTLRDHIIQLVYEYFGQDESALGMRASLLSRWKEPPGPQLVDLFWGLIAATHDIAAPLQSFQYWWRDFFTKYFGERRVASLFEVLPALLDVFHHPRFPFYKSAITNLYNSQQRNWLESIFHLGLSSRIDHALAGSLILMREIDPDGAYSGRGIWWKVTKYLEELSEEKRPEFGLVLPAYVSHAVAFSHLADMRWRWQHEHGPKEEHDEGRHKRVRPLEPLYFADTARDFSVSFRKFPLTYLIALCEVLLDRDEDAWMAKKASWKRVRMHRDRTPHSSLSPVYVKDIDSETGPSPMVILKLRLWENDLRNEGRRVCSGLDIENLARDLLGRSDFEWVVYDAELYIKEKRNWQILGDHGEYCDVDSGKGQERRLTQSIYDILTTYLRLDEFRESYICDKIRFGICFENVRNENDENILFPLTRPDDHGS